MLDKTKTDPILGSLIKNHLQLNGVDTPMIPEAENTEIKYQIISNAFKNIINAIGLDITNDSIEGTPDRMAKMYLNEICWGLNYNNFPKITTVENKMHYDEMIIEKDIKVMSLCEHHFVTIFGKAHVAYIPNNKVLGLSKMNRIVEFFSRRPQIQERLTEQIYHALRLILETDNVAVIVDAEHFCVKARGVEDTNSSTVTSKLGGDFKSNNNLRQEFLRLIG